MSFTQDLKGLSRIPLLKVIALPALLASLAWISLANNYAVQDPDLWWHLKVGDWIVANHSVPHVGILSRATEAKPWIAYSWGYEVLLSRAYAWFGLIGLATFNILVTVSVASALFCMLYRLSARFWFAWLLTFVGSYAFLYSLLPRPVFFTMIFFAVELTCLFEAQRTGRTAILVRLIPLFFLWANIHIQFIYGLAVLGLFIAIELAQRLVTALGMKSDGIQAASIQPGKASAISLACILATCLGPYTYHIYGVFAEYSRSHVPYTIILELQSLHFRATTHYVLLMLVAAGFYAIGWPKKLDLFRLALLIISALVAFRTARDAWFVCIVAAACITDVTADFANIPGTFKVRDAAIVAFAALVLIFLVARNTAFTTRHLDLAISRAYPVDAANFIRRNRLTGPLYNQLNWGGFLTWYLPDYPVSIDGRNDLYGDELDKRSFRSEQGDDYRSDPYLNNANLVLLPAQGALALMLLRDPQFRLVYEDQIARVFVRD